MLRGTSWMILLVLVASMAWGQIGRPDLLYGCDAASSAVVLSVYTPEKNDELESRRLKVERLATYELVEYTPEDERGNRYRTKSNKLLRKCGNFEIVIQGGFFNANPLGELGAVEFPFVDIFFAAKPFQKGIAIGECDAGLSLYRSQGCPENWATEVSTFFAHDGRPALNLKHVYEKIRQSP